MNKQNMNKDTILAKTGIVGIICLTIIVSIFLILNLLPQRYDLRASCNSGFVGVNLSLNNDSNQDFIKLNNIDGLNCNFSIKGNIPNQVLQKILNG